MSILTKSLVVLPDGKISATNTENKKVYIQPIVRIETLDAIEKLTMHGSDSITITIDATIETIQGDTFSGDFAQLKVLVRQLANLSNSVTSPDFLTSVGLGDVPGHKLVTMNARAPVVDKADAPQDIWCQKGASPARS